MPYIKPEDRDKLKHTIDLLVSHLEAVDDDDIEGVMNYTITTLLCKRMKPVAGWKYRWVNRAIGVLECVKMEFYRRVVKNYEDDCIVRNGDIEVYKDT